MIRGAHNGTSFRVYDYETIEDLEPIFKGLFEVA